MIHSPDVASGFYRDSVSRVDLACLDPVPGLAHLVRVDGSSGVNCPGVFRQFKNSF